MTTYTDLTHQQQEHVAFLFADEIFGTDPNSYDYELTGDVVKGRKPAQVNGDRSVKKPHNIPVSVRVLETPCVTKEQINAMEQVYQSMAKRIIERLIISQPVEA